MVKKDDIASSDDLPAETKEVLDAIEHNIREIDDLMAEFEAMQDAYAAPDTAQADKA